MRVPRPRIETIRRSVPGSLSIGDYGIATTSTALIDFIEALDAAGISGASGYSLRHSFPFQLGGTAADALLSPTRTEPGMGWAAYRVDVTWSRLPGRGDWIETRAEADHISATIVRFTVEAACRGSLCARGRIHYVGVRNGMNLATQAPIRDSAALPRTVPQGNTGKLPSRQYCPFLLKLLMNPIAGASEPLGRRLHPLGSVPLGAAVFHALSLNPDHVVLSATMRYLSPVRTDVGFVLTSHFKKPGQLSIILTDNSGICFATCSLCLGDQKQA